MIPLDDRELAEHLVRRSAPGTPIQRASRSDRLAQSIRARVAAEPQEKRGVGLPGVRWLDRLAPRRQLGVTLGAVALIVALASIGLLSGFGSRPSAPVSRSDWHLSKDELVAVVADADITGHNMGKTVIADISIAFGPMRGLDHQCPPDCMTFVFGTGGDHGPEIPVNRVPSPAACDAAADCGYPPSVPGPFAVTLRNDGSVDYVGRATLIRNGAWAFDDFVDVLRSIEGSKPAIQTLYPVLGSVVTASGGPSCAVAPTDARFGCGWPSWLVVNSPGRSIGGFGPARNGIRVQNDLASIDAPGASKTPDRAIYLLRPIAPMPSDCYVCGDIGTAEIVTTLDPIDIPPASSPSPSPSPSDTPTPTTPPDETGGVQILTVGQLEELVGTREAATRSLGRVVVVNGSILACPPTASCSSQYVITFFDGGLHFNGAIAVAAGGLDVSSAQTPYALRITGQQSVQLIAQVQPSRLSGPSGIAMTLEEYRTEIVSQQLHQPDPAGTVPHAFLVDAWLDLFAGGRSCPDMQSIPPRALDYSCGGWSWLTSGPVELSGGAPMPPPNGLLVQAQAYSDFASNPDIVADPARAAPRRGFYLITPEYSGANPCVDGHSECEVPDAASMLGRVDPIDPAVFGPTPAPTALSSHAETAVGQFRLTFDLPKTTWSSSEAISGIARLEYLGTGLIVLYGSDGQAGGPFGFATKQVGGDIDTGTVWSDVCQHVTISHIAPLSKALSKGGGYDGSGPNASFYAGFFADPLFRLPPGDWELTAVSEFTPGTGCSANEYQLQATIRIHVVP